ncbi:synaptotagmin-like protein 2 isoform X16 [Pleurodeles waltl]|uniref:synaptotagmin-like protein 2 isoform X16 n=1 Tax=Pleurodeles waltl TaxID=8319 RepID=UPI0037094316
MIDLSFLTEEEQEAIMKVLQRDAQLKKAEEDRVRVLEDTIDDTNELKNKTGQWFYEAKSKRHRDKIHGADLIRASIRKKKPLTIAELTQSRTDKTKKSWVNNVNKDLFVPPELVGVMEEPDREDEEEKTQGQLYRSAPKVDTLSFEEPPQSTIKGVSSPSKQRKNPFNDPTLEVGFELNTENHISENGSAHLYDLAEKDQQPVYAKINTPRLSKLDSSDKLQDQQPLHAEIKSPQVSKLSASDHQQGSEEELSPVLAVLRRSSAKPVPSKSLEDLSSASSKEENVNFPREDFVRSNEYDQRADKQEAFYESISEHQKTDKQESFHEPVSESPTGPSYPDNRFSDPEKVKRLSKSVPDFLQDEVSGSVMSIYSGDFGNVDIKGNIQFAIDYVDQLQEFHIFVAQCKELAVAEVKKNRSDPYVKSYLLPDKEKMGKRKTAVRKKTLNPAYNEILRYKISKQTLLTQKLNLSVWHNDMFGRNSFLGEVDIDLATWDWNNKQMNWFPLQPRTPAAGMGLEYRGEMTVALKHSTVPTSGKNAASNGEVYIWVKSCSNLPVLRGNRINSFVKCTVLPDTSRKSRQKTRTVDKTVNPVFNHTMVYDGFRAEDLREACVELTVWDHNRLSNHFLGGLRLGSGSGKSYGTPVDWMDSTSYETSLWKRMISSPDQWVEDTLQLRMLMMAKMTK